MPRRPRQKPTAHDIATEIVRRVTLANAKTGGGYVVRLSDPPTPSERMELMASRLERRPIVIMPHKCASVDEWIQHYGHLKDR